MAARTKSKVTPKYKTKYRVRNWAVYEESLRRRGDITVWFDADAVDSWNAPPSGRPGGQKEYSDVAIETTLTLRSLFHLGLRQTEGFVGYLVRLMGLELRVPDHTTLSRRGRTIDVRGLPRKGDGPLHLVIDSTGLKVVGGAVRYERHRPETTLLYQLVDAHYPVFADRMVAQGTPLPNQVQREFEDYLKCGRLEYGFLRVRCESCHGEHLVAFSCKRRGFCPSCGARRMAESAALLVDEVLPEAPMRQWVLSFPFPLRFLFASRPEIMGKVLGIVYRVLATHLIRTAGFTHKTARTGAVTLIQRFGGALNLNVHFHMLFLDGVYVDDARSGTRFRWVKAPTHAELTQLSHTIAHRVSRFLECQGLLVRDAETAYLSMDTESDDPMASLIGHSVTYRIATGPRQGRKVLTLQSLPAIDESLGAEAGSVAGFSLHAGVAAKANERNKLERLCRYITWPAASEKRLSLTEHRSATLSRTPGAMAAPM